MKRRVILAAVSRKGADFAKLMRALTSQSEFESAHSRRSISDLPVARAVRISLTNPSVRPSVLLVRRLKYSLSWALLVLMFAVALVPANGMTVLHSHDDHEVDSSSDFAGLANTYHAVGAHHAEGLHGHQVGWREAQRSPEIRQLGAPVLVAQVWLNVLAAFSPAPRSIDVPAVDYKTVTVHSPPPLLRSMAFLI